jgi:hypothetical protein
MIQTREAYEEALDFLSECLDNDEVWGPPVDELVTLLMQWEAARHPNFYLPFTPASHLKKEKVW